MITIQEQVVTQIKSNKKLLFFLVSIKNTKISDNPSIYLVRIFLNYIDIGKIIPVFMLLSI